MAAETTDITSAGTSSGAGPAGSRHLGLALVVIPMGRRGSQAAWSDAPVTPGLSGYRLFRYALRRRPIIGRLW
jgi:hypothetical protein